MRLDGKVAVVTGASSGIGRAIAIGCAREGADLAITYRGNEAGAEETAERHPASRARVEVLRRSTSAGTRTSRPWPRRSGSASAGSTPGSTTPAPTS